MEDNNKIIIGYKGFDKNFRCKGFQYEVGKDYEHDGDVICCESGFHFCTNPLDVFKYYNPANSRFCKVVGNGEIQSGDDSKVAVSKIHISEEIGLTGLINEGVKILKKNKYEHGRLFCRYEHGKLFCRYRLWK